MSPTSPNAVDRSLCVLAIDPFHGGSHRAFLDGVAKYSRHEWSLLTGKPVHWKWRMRSAPIELAVATAEHLESHPRPDVIFCSDMLDLPQWRGFLRDPEILSTPTVIYFHENQWTYPQSPEARYDLHFGYTNLLSALASDLCLFNSSFHQHEFLAASRKFLARMPDTKHVHDLDSLAERSQVLSPGFDPPSELTPHPIAPATGPLVIGWVSRWEHDKRPDRFYQLLRHLSDHRVDFRLVLLGPRPRVPSEAHQRISTAFSDWILHDGFAASRESYWQQLQSIDVVVSSADHEFFGIAICEAIWAGAVPILPNRLSYPELAPPSCLYDSIDEAADQIALLGAPNLRAELRTQSRRQIESLQMERTVQSLDECLSELHRR